MGSSVSQIESYPNVATSLGTKVCIFKSTKEKSYKGGIRDVYMGRFVGAGNKACVVKKFKKHDFNTHKNWTCDVNASLKAKNLATRFYEKVINCEQLHNVDNNKRVTFLIPEIVLADRTATCCNHTATCSDCYAIVEDYIPGTYKKYSDNKGKLENIDKIFLTAFSHWTYVDSNGKLLVCDLQGVEMEKEYKLTDPAIHSTEGHYGLTDLMNTGMKNVMENHTCNKVCKILKLPKYEPSEEDKKNRKVRKMTKSKYSSRTLDELSEKEREINETAKSNMPPTPEIAFT